MDDPSNESREDFLERWRQHEEMCPSEEWVECAHDIDTCDRCGNCGKLWADVNAEGVK
jgi:hypothetical protein